MPHRRPRRSVEPLSVFIDTESSSSGSSSPLTSTWSPSTFLPGPACLNDVAVGTTGAAAGSSTGNAVAVGLLRYFRERGGLPFDDSHVFVRPPPASLTAAASPAPQPPSWCQTHCVAREGMKSLTLGKETVCAVVVPPPLPPPPAILITRALVEDPQTRRVPLSPALNRMPAGDSMEDATAVDVLPRWQVRRLTDEEAAREAGLRPITDGSAGSAAVDLLNTHYVPALALPRRTPQQIAKAVNARRTMSVMETAAHAAQAIPAATAGVTAEHASPTDLPRTASAPAPVDGKGISQRDGTYTTSSTNSRDSHHNHGSSSIEEKLPLCDRSDQFARYSSDGGDQSAVLDGSHSGTQRGGSDDIGGHGMNPHSQHHDRRHLDKHSDNHDYGDIEDSNSDGDEDDMDATAYWDAQGLRTAPAVARGVGDPTYALTPPLRSHVYVEEEGGRFLDHATHAEVSVARAAASAALRVKEAQRQRRAQRREQRTQFHRNPDGDMGSGGGAVTPGGNVSANPRIPGVWSPWNRSSRDSVDPRRYRHMGLVVAQYLHRVNVFLSALGCGAAVILLLAVALPSVEFRVSVDSVAGGVIGTDSGPDVVTASQSFASSEHHSQYALGNLSLVVLVLRLCNAPFYLFISLVLITSSLVPLMWGLADAHWRHQRSQRRRAMQELMGSPLSLDLKPHPSTAAVRGSPSPDPNREGSAAFATNDLTPHYDRNTRSPRPALRSRAQPMCATITAQGNGHGTSGGSHSNGAQLHPIERNPLGRRSEEGTRATAAEKIGGRADPLSQTEYVMGDAYALPPSYVNRFTLRAFLAERRARRARRETRRQQQQQAALLEEQYASLTSYGEALNDGTASTMMVPTVGVPGASLTMSGWDTSYVGRQSLATTATALTPWGATNRRESIGDSMSLGLSAFMPGDERAFERAVLMNEKSFAAAPPPGVSSRRGPVSPRQQQSQKHQQQRHYTSLGNTTFMTGLTALSNAVGSGGYRSGPRASQGDSLRAPSSTNDRGSLLLSASTSQQQQQSQSQLQQRQASVSAYATMDAITSNGVRLRMADRLMLEGGMLAATNTAAATLTAIRRWLAVSIVGLSRYVHGVEVLLQPRLWCLVVCLAMTVVELALLDERSALELLELVATPVEASITNSGGVTVTGIRGETGGSSRMWHWGRAARHSNGGVEVNVTGYTNRNMTTPTVVNGANRDMSASTARPLFLAIYIMRAGLLSLVWLTDVFF